MDISPSSTTNTVLTYYTYLANFMLVLVYIGVGIKKPGWMTTTDYYLKIFVSIYLLYRFNPFRSKIMFRELDRRIVFTAGVILFTSTLLNKILLITSAEYRKQILPILKN